MEKTLLGIIGSPRKQGNCEVFVKAVFRRLRGPWQLRLMRLPELDIRPCRACYACLFEPMKCVQDDDFNMALQAFVEADAWVVAAPAYLLGANSSLKRFLDRGLSFYAHVDRLWGKPAAGVAVAGIEGKEGYTKLSVESFIRLALGDLRASAVIYGALPGEVLLGENAADTAAQMAAALESPDERHMPGSPSCPVCGGDTFRFLGGGRVRCMLCSSAGDYEVTGGEICFRTAADDHPLFLTPDAVRRHAQWLRAMKERYLSQRRELRAVVREYSGIGTWVHSEKGQ